MLTLPCTGRELLHEVIIPALVLLPSGMDSHDARCMLVAIAKQESDLKHVRQGGNGPARGLWQFERIGCQGVIEHHRSDDLAAMVCREARLPCVPSAVMRAIVSDHATAARFARLNLWTDRLSLPKAHPASEEQAFQCYRRVWRPGAAKTPGSKRYIDARERWHTSWKVGLEAVSHD